MAAPPLAGWSAAALDVCDWVPHIAAAACLCGVALGWHLARWMTVPFDADRYFPLTHPDEVVLRGALKMCNAIQDHTTRCYFKGRIREMVRLQPICDAEEFAKMSKDLHAEVDDCLHFGTCFRYGSPEVRWDLSGLPRGPDSLLGGAELLADIMRMHRVLCNMAKRYGRVFPVQFPGNPLWVVVSGSKEAKAIFHDHGATISSRTFGQAHLITHSDFPAGNFLRCPYNEDFKKRRGVVWREALSKQRVDFFKPLLERCRHVSLRAFLAVAETGAPFNPRPYLRMAYLNTLACILFGITFSDVEDPAYKRVYETVDAEASEPLAGAADIFKVFRHTPLYTLKAERMKKIRASQEAWLNEQIKAREARLARGEPPETLCDLLLQTLDSPCPGQRLSYESVKEICNEVIFAGTDTTATTTETVLAHLLNNPDKAKKLQAELDEVAKRAGGLPSSADFAALRYTNAVIREAMRMTCAVPFNAHTCTADTEVLGYKIPKGAMCINNIYAIHYDPEIYPNPDRFEPERWFARGDPCHWSVENDFEFMPFGVGRRICLGYNLALENLQLFMSALFLSFDFSSATGRPVSMRERTEFTVSVPEFQVRASVRGCSPVGRDPAAFRALPASIAVPRTTSLKAVEKAGGAPAPAGPPRERWLVWYGSQTGTAEAFASALAQEARRRGVDCAARSLERVRPRGGGPVNLRPGGEDKVIFIVATFGNGEPTDSAVEFGSWLRQGEADLTGLSFAVFGLGNSAYEHYNAMAKLVDAQLAKMGGARIEGVHLGLGDASKDLDGAFDEWTAGLLGLQAPKPAAAGPGDGQEAARGGLGGGPGASSPGRCSWEVVWQPEPGSVSDPPPSKPPKSAAPASSPATATLVGVRELARRPSEAGSTIEVTLDLRGAVTYQTADTVGVCPANPPECVEALGALLGQPLDVPFALAPLAGEGEAAEEPPVCSPTTLREVLSTAVDILGKPSRRLVLALAQFCGDPSERRELDALCSESGRARWDEMAASRELSLLQLFAKYRSLSSVPLASLLEIVPQMRLKPRYYTASSCPSSVGADSLTLTVKVLGAHALKLGDRTVQAGGVASAFLASARAGDLVRVFVQPSAFKLPRDPSTPIIMVAAGTGLAPFRGFLQERRVLQEAGASLGEASLFFGCRRADADFICEGELADHVRRGTLSQLVLACSREDPRRKVYVQDRLADLRAEVVTAVLDGGAHVYVCGSTAMGRAVRQTLLDLLAARLGRAAAEAAVASMEQSGRYVAELWA